MKYAVTYSERLCHTYLVEADNEEDAYNMVQSAVESGDIVLGADDYLCESGNIEVDEPFDDYMINNYDILDANGVHKNENAWF